MSGQNQIIYGMKSNSINLSKDQFEFDLAKWKILYIFTSLYSIRLIQQQQLWQHMENRQIFYKIGQLPQRKTLTLDEPINQQGQSIDHGSAIEMKLNCKTRLEQINELNIQNLESFKQSISLQNSAKVSKRKFKKQKPSKEQSLPKFDEIVNERNKFNQKPDMLRAMKNRGLIKLFRDKATLNSVLRKPVTFNPFENIFSQQNSCFFKKLNFEQYKRTINTIYIIKIIFAALYFFIFPLTLLYHHLTETSFVLIIKLCAIILNSFDLLQTLQKDYSADSNNALNKEKYQHFVDQKRRKVIFQVFILLASTFSFIFNHSSEANLLFITVSFNISHLAEQVHQLQEEFLTVTYIHKYWNLLKVILKNLFVCHLLACCLVAVSYINPEENWMIPNGIDQLTWYEQYIWSYYFGTTIILTIGFGDLHPNNTIEAFFIIVISFFACVFFGYNINYIGNLINSIKQDENQKNTKLKLLNSLSKKATISKGVYHDISRYIVEESKIKQQFNYGEQKKLLKELPQSLRSSFLQEANAKLFNHLKQIIPLSSKAIEKLSLKIQARFCHPNQLIRGNETTPSIIILQSGEVGYIARSKYPSKLKNVIIQRISSDISSQSKLVCADLLLDSPLNYDIKSLDYSVIYEMDKATFEESIIQSKKDYQVYRSILDKCKFKLNEFALVKCRFCDNKMHTLFQCPRIHYQPFRKTLPLKSLKSSNNSKQQRVKCIRNKKLLQCQVIVQSKIFSQAQIQKQYTLRSGTMAGDGVERGITQQKSLKSLKSLKKIIKASNQHNDMTIRMVGQLRSEIQNLTKDSLNQFHFTLWDNTDCDSACNFQFYFSKWNPDYIREKQVKNTFMNRTTRLKRKAKMLSSN